MTRLDRNPITTDRLLRDWRRLQAAVVSTVDTVKTLVEQVAGLLQTHTAEGSGAHGGIIPNDDPRLSPPGGTTGQALVKSSNDDYDMEWGDVSGGGGATEIVIVPGGGAESAIAGRIYLLATPISASYRHTLDPFAWKPSSTAGSPEPLPSAAPVAWAFDGDELTASSKWFANASSGWISGDLGATRDVNAYAITSGNDIPNRDPKNWTFQGSDDNSTWVTLDTQTDQSWSGRNQRRTYILAATASYRYYKLSVSAVQSGSELQVAELWMYDFSTVTLPPTPAANDWIEFRGAVCLVRGNGNLIDGASAQIKKLVILAYDGTSWVSYI